MKWHPIKSILAIGWETGDIQIWNDTEKHLYEPQTNHCMEIKSLDWTSSGSRLLSCDYVRLFKTTYWLTHWLFQFYFSLYQSHILCGLSWHLNHLITLRVAISHRPFRTLLFGIFCHIDILGPILVIFTTHQQSCKKVIFSVKTVSLFWKNFTIVWVIVSWVIFWHWGWWINCPFTAWRIDDRGSVSIAYL